MKVDKSECNWIKVGENSGNIWKWIKGEESTWNW